MSHRFRLKLVSFLQNAATDPWATYPIAPGRGQPIQKVPSRDGYPRGSSRIVQSRWEVNGPAAQCIGYYPPWIVSHYPRTRCAVQWQAGSPGRLTYHRLSLPKWWEFHCGTIYLTAMGKARDRAVDQVSTVAARNAVACAQESRSRNGSYSVAGTSCLAISGSVKAAN